MAITRRARLSSFDMRHQLRVISVYELPFGQQKKFASHGWLCISWEIGG
jgi:hypothetical protein